MALYLERLFVNRTEMRAYFYKDHALPPERDPDHTRVLSVREFVADSLEGRDNRDVYSRSDWASWKDYITSPAAPAPPTAPISVGTDSSVP